MSTDLSGKKFGRLHVLTMHGVKITTTQIRKYKTVIWNCQCSCGVKKLVPNYALVSGHTQSCGCLRRETTSNTASKHGMSYSNTYVAWYNMFSRCENPNVPAYKNYGARGVTVCKRWKKFENFLSDMGPCPSGLTLERKNNSKNYTPKNCTWATYKQQANNRRQAFDVVKLTFEGKTLSICDWSNITGIASSVLHARHRRGWSIKTMLTTAIIAKNAD